jgi:hypothetical protein
MDSGQPLRGFRNDGAGLHLYNRISPRLMLSPSVAETVLVAPLGALISTT